MIYKKNMRKKMHDFSFFFDYGDFFDVKFFYFKILLNTFFMEWRSNITFILIKALFFIIKKILLC